MNQHERRSSAYYETPTKSLRWLSPRFFSISLIDKWINMFWNAFKQSIAHAFATFFATLLVWAIWMGWFVFIAGNYGMQWDNRWDIYRFGMIMAVIISLILCSGFLVMSLIYHYFVKNIPRSREILSSLTLASSSLILLLVLPDGGVPLIALLIGLPILANLWMLRSRGGVKVISN